MTPAGYILLTLILIVILIDVAATMSVLR